MIFNGPFESLEDNEPVPASDEKDGEDGLFLEDEFESMKAKFEDQFMNKENLQDVKVRLQQQSEQRREQLKSARKHEMTKEEFNEKWALPAYLRRGVKMQDVPHSSESFISKYNLNDDNSILGNNKFLHDNVD